MIFHTKIIKIQNKKSNPPSKHCKTFQKFTFFEKYIFFIIFSDFLKKTRKPNFEIWPWDPSRSLSHVLLSNMAQELCQTALLRSVSSHLKFSLELWSAGRPELLACGGSWVQNDEKPMVFNGFWRVQGSKW